MRHNGGVVRQDQLVSSHRTPTAWIIVYNVSYWSAWSSLDDVRAAVLVFRVAQSNKQTNLSIQRSLDVQRKNITTLTKLKTVYKLSTNNVLDMKTYSFVTVLISRNKLFGNNRVLTCLIMQFMCTSPF